jgi:hypothetical protein
MLVALIVALPSGLVASCSATNCAEPGYETFTGRLVETRGAIATYTVDSVVGGEYPASTAKVGRPLAIRYPAGEVKLLRAGTSYRVEISGPGDGLASSINPRPCLSGTTFTDGSAIHAQTSWQRYRAPLGVALVLAAAVVIAAMWVRRRRTRGERDRLAA